MIILNYYLFDINSVCLGVNDMVRFDILVNDLTFHDLHLDILTPK